MAETSLKVLIVDDDKFLVDLYTRKFILHKYEVTAAGSGAEALAKLREGYLPDIVLLDVIMPAMDGLEVLSEIRKQDYAPSATYIILSNQGQQSEIGKAEQLGIAGYIVKASTIPSEVLKMVERIYTDHKKK